jgi:hypothetical protein
MQRSTDRILTTHAGSLARPADLLAMVRVKDAGQPYDHAAFAARVRTAVAEVVGKQMDAGIDVVSDGEQGKPGFAHYVKDRLTGLVTREGLPPRISSDQAEFPDFQPPEGGTLNTRRTVCIGPLGWKDRTAVQTDIENLQAALQTVQPQPTEAFLPAVSPGTLAQNVINEYYKDEEAFLQAVAEVMREEYHAIVQAGFLLQIDSPDLAMGWHRFCRKFSFEALCGMIFLHDQRYIMREHDDGDQFQRGAFPPRGHSDGGPLVCGVSAEHAPRRRTHARAWGPRGSLDSQPVGGQIQPAIGGSLSPAQAACLHQLAHG